jgi:hypothetical protein
MTEKDGLDRHQQRWPFPFLGENLSLFDWDESSMQILTRDSLDIQDIATIRSPRQVTLFLPVENSMHVLLRLPLDLNTNP